MCRYFSSRTTILFALFLTFTVIGCLGTEDTATIASITVTPAYPNVPLNSTQQFTAIGNYTDNSIQDVTSSVTWSSLDTSVAIINSTSGLASTVAAGVTNITATDPDTLISTTIRLTVVAAIVNSLYSDNGANWNDYVVGGNITNATDTACDADIDTACINGGMYRTFEVMGISSCTDITVEDSLLAFNWTCDESTNPVTIVSTGFKNDIGITNLIDFDNSTWLNNYVEVSDNSTLVYVTATTQWWDNPIVTNNDGGTLDTAGTIYSVTADNSNRYIVNASSVGLVSKDEVTISNTVTGSGSVNARDYLLLDNLTIDVAGIYFVSGVALDTVRFSALRNLKVSGAVYEGVILGYSTNNTLTGITVVSSQFGVEIYYGSNNTLSNITVSNNTNHGVLIYTSTNNTLTNIMLDNNYNGLKLNGSDYNTLTNITTNNNSQYGVEFYHSDNNTLMGALVTNNPLGGLYLNNGNYNKLTDITADDSENGLFLITASYNILSDIRASGNNHGVHIERYSSNNRLSDITASGNGWGVYLDLYWGDNILSDIMASGNADGGIFASDSTNNIFSGIMANDNSTGVRIMGYSTNSMFSGITASGNEYHGVTINGSSNNNTLSSITASGNNGHGVSITRPAANNTLSDITSSNNDYGVSLYSTSDNHYTGLLKVGTNTTYDCYVSSGTNPGLLGIICDDGAGGYGTNSSDAIFTNGVSTAGSFVDSDNGDYTLLDTDTVLLDTVAYPATGDSASTLTHTWDDTSTTTFLSGAVEILDDGIGNDDTLCETDETCMYSPNMGAYQGHGNIINSTPAFTDGDTITGVTLKEYEFNGY